MMWLLSLAADAGQLVWIECGYCRGRRYYMPDDLRRLFGNVDVATLPRRMRCEKCGRRDNIECDVYLPVASERERIKVRRLKDVKVRKNPHLEGCLSLAKHAWWGFCQALHSR